LTFSVDAIPQIGQWLTGAALFCCGLFVYLLARDDHKPLAGVVAALYILLNPYFTDIWGGEALPQLALILAAFFFYFRGHEVVPALLLALAFLTRGEGVLPAFVIYAHYIIVKRKLPWRAAIAFGAILVPWLVYAMLTFGSPLPSTLYAKIAQMESGYFAPFLITSLEWLAAYVIPTPHFAHSPNYSYLVAVVLAAIGGLSLLIRPQFRWWAIFIWLGLYVIGYSLLGIPFYHWYAAPLMLGSMILVGLGTQFVYDLLNQKMKTVGKGYRRVVLIALALTICFPLITTLDFIRAYAIEPVSPAQSLYTKTGRWLKENTPETATVGYFEIGFMGYYADRPMIDPVGLVNPGVSKQVAKGDVKWAYLHYKPDYLLINAVRWYDRLGNIQDESWFNEAYQQVATIEETGYFDSPITIYQKVNGAAIPSPQD
jgi:hypothetical protein